MHKQIPNILTSLRVLITPVFCYYLFNQTGFNNPFSKTLFLILIYVVAALSDFFDGYFARKYNLQSKFGEFVDPLADKLFTLSIFFCYAFLDSVSVPLWAVILIAFREIFITLFRTATLGKEVSMKTAFHGKAKTVSQIVAQSITLISLLIISMVETNRIVASDFLLDLFKFKLPYIFTLIATIFTIYSGVIYVITNRKVFSK